jgi:chromosome segregation ATPase
MSRYTESRELVQAIGREILAEGRGVTNVEVAEKIMERTGRRVSPNLLTEELQRFWALIGTELAQRHHIPDVPPGVAQAAQAFWAQAVQAADERWSAEKRETAEALEKAQARVTKLAKELDEAHDQYREAEMLLRTERASYVQLSGEHQALLERFQDQERVCTAAQAQVTALEDQLTSAKQALAYQQQAHEREQQMLQERISRAQQDSSSLRVTVEGLQLQLEQKDADLDRLRLDREQDQQAILNEKLRVERLTVQVQALERQERATRRTRAAPVRRRT